MGRLVDLERFEAVQTLVDPPDEEVTAPANDVALVRSRDWRIAAFRLSNGARLWEQMPDAPCRNLIVAGSSVYSGCGDKVFARALESGKTTVIDAGPHAEDPIVAGALLVVPHQDGRINVYDLATGQRRASRVLPELSRAFHRDVLANPRPEGVCVLGLVSLSAQRLDYRAGCYDDHLVSRWSKTLTMRPPRDPVYELRQLGPRFLVLDDQESALDSLLPPGPGRGLVVRWRDGQVTPFSDQTFATFDGTDGERLPAADNDAFHRTRTLRGDYGSSLRNAQIVTDDQRAFALITNGPVALAGLDRATGRDLFLVPVPVAHVSKLGLAAGMPVVRSQRDQGWEVTVYDPRSGHVLYHDARVPPRTR